MGTLLEVKDVHVSYGNIEAVKGVSLSVAKGEIVTLIGANGAGKTTILRTISGLLRPSSGEVTFDGRRIDNESADAIVRGGVGHAPEGRRVFARMTVRENLEMGAFARSKEHASEITADFERVYTLFPILKERDDQAAGTLSGGEQQMLAIGRALMARPVLLMLDEPSLGLAPAMVATVFRVVDEIRRQGVTVLMVEQNAALALRMADRGYVMEGGRVVLEGKGQDLLDNADVRRAYLGG